MVIGKTEKELADLALLADKTEIINEIETQITQVEAAAVVLNASLASSSNININEAQNYDDGAAAATASHIALKLEKSAISKVQKHIFCSFKNRKKSIFAPEKSLKLPKLQFSDFFLVQKLIFCHF